MNATTSMGWDALDLDCMGVQPLREKDLVTISAGISPASAGLMLAFGFVGAVVAGAVIGVAVFYLTH